MKKYQGYMWVAILLNAVMTLMQIVISFALAYFFTAAENGDIVLLYWVIGISIAVLLLEFLVWVLFNKAKYAYISKSMTAKHDEFFRRDIVSVGDVDMATYSSKTELFATQYYANKILVPSCIIQIVVTCIAYIYINYIFIIYMAAFTGLMLLVPVVTAKGNKVATEKYTTKSAQYISYLGNIFAGKGELQNYGVTDSYTDKHAQQARSLFGKYSKYNVRMQNINAFSNMFAFLVFVGLMIITAFLVLAGQLELAMFMTVVQLMNYFISPVYGIISSTTQYNAIKGQLQVEAGEQCALQPTTMNSSWVVSNGVFSYPEQQDIVYPDSITFDKNKKYLINGKSGSGKSTLAHILSGTLQLSSGDMIIDGKVLGEGQCLPQVCYVPQSSHLFYDNLFDNVSLYRDISQDDILRALQFCNVPCDSEFLSKQFTPDSDLSGGEKQRVSLARAVVDMPSIMILDEPTASLDYVNALDILTKMCGVEGLTLIVISHETDSKLLQLFDHTITLRGADEQ